MIENDALHALLDGHFQRLEPVVFLADGVYVKSDRFDDGATFVTAQGRAHALRRLCSRRALDEQVIRRNIGAVGRLIRSRLARTRTENCRDDLRYFVDGLLPAFQGRDWSEHFDIDATREAAKPPCAGGLAGAVDAVSPALPAPVLPTPSLLLLGRVWRLATVQGAARGDHVCYGGKKLVPSHNPVSVGRINRLWREAADAFAAQAVARLAEAAGDAGPCPAVAAAREEIVRTGCLERGDLLFLPGPPPRVGHVVPPHYNRVLGRHSERNLAMTVALTRPPRLATPEVFVRNDQGQWCRFYLPNGLCLGNGPPGLRPEDPGLALLAYLRWAALRIAGNGAFHSNDDRATEYES